MGTKVKLNPKLDDRVRVHVLDDDFDAEAICLSSRMLVIDDVPWDADLDVIRSGLVAKKRKFKQPFQDRDATSEVRSEVEKIGDYADRLFRSLFRTMTPTSAKNSFRPMITGPEPLHFDTYGGTEQIAAFVNVSRVPRLYAVGHSFEQIVEKFPDVMREVASECSGDLVHLSYAIRCRTIEGGRPPLGDNAPRHFIELAPGSIWFFNPKTVSHQVVYGEGASGHAWELPGQVPTQQKIIAPLLGMN